MDSAGYRCPPLAAAQSGTKVARRPLLVPAPSLDRPMASLQCRGDGRARIRGDRLARRPPTMSSATSRATSTWWPTTDRGRARLGCPRSSPTASPARTRPATPHEPGPVLRTRVGRPLGRRHGEGTIDHRRGDVTKPGPARADDGGSSRAPSASGGGWWVTYSGLGHLPAIPAMPERSATKEQLMHTACLATPTVGRAAPLGQVTIQGTAGVARDPRRRLLRALAGPANASPVHRGPRQGPPDRPFARHRHPLADPRCENRRG